MVITKNILADMIMKYINRTINLSALVEWAENTLREDDFDKSNFELIRNIVARIGLSDVREFGLAWDDCYDYLHKLGFDVKVELLKV
ncbi:MAG: hypothetical protein AAB242_02395 [Nitrospirota bacterium]